MLYVALVAILASVCGNPAHQTYRTNPLLFYPSPYVHTGLNQLVQYPLLGKSLQNINSPNELYFYPNAIQTQHLIVGAPSRFTAPPEGLVQAIYAWFAENNLPIPGENPTKNEISPEKPAEAPEKPTAGEAEVLAEADRNPHFNYPKKVGAAIKPGQRFYILNGQPQFFGNYQPVYPGVQTRNVYPDQNVLVLQPDFHDFKPKPAGTTPIRNVLLKSTPAEQTADRADANQERVTPVRYHGQSLKPNVLYLRSGHQELKNQAVVQNQFLHGLFPQLNDYQNDGHYQAIRSGQLSQYPIQTQYIPVEVVPPQEKVQEVPVHLSHLAQAPVVDTPKPQDLSYFQIPVSKDVQAPSYIKTFQIKAKVPEQRDGYFYLQMEDKALNANDQRPEINQDEDKNQQNIAAAEFARYLAAKQQYSDSVVIDAKENKEDEDTESEDITSDAFEEPSIAQAQPGGIALAGVGGVASTAPRGTALVGPNGLAVASPQATAVAGPNTEEKKKTKRT